jgi:hypothetical protein
MKQILIKKITYIVFTSKFTYEDMTKIIDMLPIYSDFIPFLPILPEKGFFLLFG